MNKYFSNQLLSTPNIAPEEVVAYRELVITEMEKLGASESEKALLHDATIKNSIRKKRLPEDVAWAILQ